MKVYQPYSDQRLRHTMAAVPDYHRYDYIREGSAYDHTRTVTLAFIHRCLCSAIQATSIFRVTRRCDDLCTTSGYGSLYACPVY